MTNSPTLADHLYQEGWSCSRLIDIYNSLIQGETIHESSAIAITELLESIHEPLLTTIIRTLLQDEPLMVLLESQHLHDTVAAVFVSIIWQFHRKKETEIESSHFSNADSSDLLEFITINSEHFPCVDQLKLSLSAIPAHDMSSLLCTAMDKALNDFNRAENEMHAISNVMELMIHFKHPSFLPKIVDVFLHDSETFDDRLIDQTTLALATFGDAAIEFLDSKQEEALKSHQLELLNLIKKTGTERAEEFLIKHFDRFMEDLRPDTLDTCMQLVSEKVLKPLKHKVGKKQRGIDELYIIVKTFKGEADAETRRLLALLPPPGDNINTAMDILSSKTALPVLNLPLECSNCGDVSYYDCRDILVSSKGDPYVVDELTCISCGKICEFTVTPPGRTNVTMEMLRMNILKSRDKIQGNPLTGAVRILKTSTMGKEMSVADGIALYKEQIRKKPNNPDNYIGLGNIFKFLGQHTFGEEQYKKAIEHGPFYIEAYLGLAEMARKKENYETALDWLERGRPYLKRPLICKNLDVSADKIIEAYVLVHAKLLKLTNRVLPSIAPSEYRVDGKRLNKIGRNETCPCGSGKKYKKCCMKKR